MMYRRSTAAAAILASALLLAACGTDRSGDDVTTTVTGNCALSPDKYQLSPLSDAALTAALGHGSYTMHGDIGSAPHPSADGKDWGAPGVPMDGSCDYTDAVGVRRLTVTIDNKDLPYNGYASARKTQRTDPRATPIPGVDGYYWVDDADGDQRAGANIFTDKLVYGVELRVPGDGVDVATEVVKLAKEAAANLAKPMPRQTNGSPDE